ncbi:MAG: thioredoxin family protein [Acidimicrobiia bacterium]|nr:thioredoxin family protein [Acidimicrobiia bacterium]
MIFKRRTKPINLEHVDQIDELAASGKPVFLDFWQTGCQSCRTMDGVISELADEYSDSAHVVKVNIRNVPLAAQRFRVMATPTFVVYGASRKKQSKKSKRQGGGIGERWRASGLVKKQQLEQALERNGASRAAQ